MPTRAKRLLWIVNHRTLLQAEVPIFESLGYEVLVPKIIPEDDPGYRSGTVTYEHDKHLTVAPAAMTVLNTHDFYQRRWSPTLIEILNANFDVVVTSISSYVTPLAAAAHNFGGTVIARVFGREHPRRYTEFFLDPATAPILTSLAALGDRFVFAQGYDNLAEIEDPVFRDRAHTVTVPLPPQVYGYADTWVGDGDHAVLLCPGILESGYYREQYEGIKRCFGDLPHRIFGRQVMTIDDVAVLPYLSDEELFALYARAPVFVYPSTEPRHVHYSPLEAMVVGTPVLFRQGALIDVLAGGSEMPGACADTDEMHARARALLAGDSVLAKEIRASQHEVVEKFSSAVATRQWSELFATAGLR